MLVRIVCRCKLVILSRLWAVFDRIRLLGTLPAISRFVRSYSPPERQSVNRLLASEVSRVLKFPSFLRRRCVGKVRLLFRFLFLVCIRF